MIFTSDAFTNENPKRVAWPEILIHGKPGAMLVLTRYLMFFTDELNENNNRSLISLRAIYVSLEIVKTSLVQ